MSFASARGKGRSASRRIARRAGSGASGGGPGLAGGAIRSAEPGMRVAGAAAPRVTMPAQRTAKVSEPGDRHEQEAEAVASRVVAGRAAGPISSIGVDAAAAHREAVQAEKVPEEENAIQKAAAEKEPEEEPAVQKAEAEKVPEEETRAVQRAVAEMQDPKRQIQKAEVEKVPEEEEPGVQRQTAPEEEPEERVQRQTAPEEEPEEQVQRQTAPEEEPEERVPRSGRGGVARGGPAAASHAIATRGPGRPLEPSTRSALEPRLGVDLGRVRIHDDARAREAARALDSRAFTHGNDVWLGPGESDGDVRLMAHEATHVAQQRGGVPGPGVHRRLVQRATPVETADSPDKVDVPGKGSIDAKGKTIRVARVKVPSWKLGFTNPKADLSVPRAGTRDTEQVKKWEKEVKSEIGPRMEAKLDRSDDIRLGGSRVFFLEYEGGGGYLLGSKPRIKERVRRPEWDARGKPHYFDVDHKQEIQLGGADDISNMWLLDAEANQTSGSRISSEITSRVEVVLSEARKSLGDKVPSSAIQARKDYDVTIERVIGGLATSGNHAAKWEVGDIRKGEPLEPLRVLSEEEAKDRNLIGPGTQSRLLVFTAATGGATANIPWDPTSNRPEGEGPWRLYDSFRLTGITWDGNAGSVTGRAFEGNRFFDEMPITLPIKSHGLVSQAAVVEGRNIEAKLRSLQLAGLSPVQVEFAELRDPVGIYIRGKVLPTVPLIKDVGIDLVVEGNDVYLEKTFTASDFMFPGPIEVTEASLALAAGTVGLRITGEVRFEVERVGKGSLKGTAGATAEGGSFSLEGEFEFDTDLFDKAKVEVWYRPPKFGGAGELAIKAGKIKGIKSASASVAFEDERIEAKGTIEPDIKGMERGDLAILYEKEKGLQISGSLQLSKDIPGIKSGTMSASLKEKEGGGWALGGSITAEAGIPGVSATVSGTYDDGAFQIEGTVGYEKGFLKGSLTLGATNQAVGEDGKPAGEGTDKLTAYGGGEVTLRLAPWLQGTVGLNIKRDGGVVVSGEVGLPSAFELFPEKKLSKNIVTINIDIPIVGFTVLGQRVGVFATIGGGLDAQAGIGPGQLRKAELRVTYDPANEEATTVTGGGQLYIPARAGLRLFVRGGIGAGIPVVSATAGLEVGGALGIEGALESDLQVNWMPVTGLMIDTTVSAYAQPKFKFDVTGFVEVTVSYLVGSKKLYDKRWQLAAVEYGSDLRFGLRLPIHYEEGKAFDVSLSDIEFEYPKIDTSALLKGLIKQIA